jgi:hypothetical protein
MRRWLENYGFALLVLVALVCASYLAGSAKVPERIPDYALQSEEVYRLEIGAGFFVAFYLALMTVVLAFSGRGFAEFGARGLKTETVVGRQRRLDHRTVKKLASVHTALVAIEGRIESQEQRLEKLEVKR